MDKREDTREQEGIQEESLDGSAKASPSAKRAPRREVKYADWYAEGLRRFGATNKWEFKCANCGHVQTMDDFMGLVKDPNSVAAFSCLGRWKQGVGCNWTLGGLFQIHTLTVDRDGEKFPVFEFSDEAAGLGGGEAVAVPTSPSTPHPQRED